jgi:hypothetical protein
MKKLITSKKVNRTDLHKIANDELMERADHTFQPAIDSEILPRELRKYLLEETQTYTYGKKFASGLRFLLKYLDEYTGNEYILKLIGILLHSGMSLGNIYDAEEQSERLTNELLLDTRLDSLFSECSICGSIWVPAFQFVDIAKITTLNAVGGECTNCGRVFCRVCVENVHVGIDMSLPKCPECGSSLAPLRKAAGRRPMQAKRVKLPLEFVLFLRDGPIVPDAEYIQTVLRELCPDVLDGNEQVKIRAIPIANWHHINDIYFFSTAILAKINPDYLSNQYQLEPLAGIHYGDNIYILRVYKKFAPDVKPPVFEIDDREVDGLSSKIGNVSKRTGESGVFFWFNWEEISKSGHPAYGRYVYKHLLPYFSPQNQEVEPGYYYFLDGDFISDGPVHIPSQGIEERQCLEKLSQIGTERCYVVAVYGMGLIDFSKINQALRDSNIIGYIGMTTCPPIGFEKFYNFTGQMALVPAVSINGQLLERQSFEFLNENQLREMGFEVYDSK